MAKTKRERFKTVQRDDGRWECSTPDPAGIKTVAGTAGEAVEAHAKFLTEYREYQRLTNLHLRGKCDKQTCTICTTGKLPFREDRV